jgi:hypothetical protein
VRGCRGWIKVVLLAGALAGCGNFSLSGILDAPPPDAPPPDSPPAGPMALTLVPVTVNVPVSALVKFTAQGGVPPYAWAEDTNGTGGSIDPTGLYTAPTIAGTYTVSVTDSDGASQEATVFASATVPLSISPATITIAADGSVTFLASGGSGNYDWSLLQGDGTLASATYTAPGFAETAKIRLTDTATSDTRDATVTVTAPPAVLTISPTTVSLATGQTMAFSAGGGVEPYAYSVLTGGAGGSIIAAGLYTAPASAGTDTVRVTDQASFTSEATVTVFFPLTIVPTSVTVQTGGTYAFSASGGVPPYSYSAASGAVDSNGVYTAPTSAGTDTVEVVDSIGNASTAVVTVETPPVGWTIVSIDAAARSGQYASLALDGTGDPQIAYYESQRKELRLAAWNGTAWSIATVDTNNRPGQYASLALESSTGRARISYYESKNANLMYADWNGSSWNTRTVESSGSVGKFTSLALAADGSPRIAYYDAGGTQLKYVEKNGTVWGSPVVVDTTGEVGQFASLALAPDGSPRIAYYDATIKKLKYVERTGAVWGSPEVVEATADDVGQYASLALDASGNPRIAYYDATTKKLKYVEKNDAVWGSPEVVEATSNDVGQYASLALDASGDPRIAYCDATAKKLKYVEKSGAVWGTPEVVEVTAGDVGKFASLRLDPTTGKPRIAYYNAIAQDLKFARK